MFVDNDIWVLLCISFFSFFESSLTKMLRYVVRFGIDFSLLNYVCMLLHTTNSRIIERFYANEWNFEHDKCHTHEDEEEKTTRKRIFNPKMSCMQFFCTFVNIFEMRISLSWQTNKNIRILLLIDANNTLCSNRISHHTENMMGIMWFAVVLQVFHHHRYCCLLLQLCFVQDARWAIWKESMLEHLHWEQF